MIHKSSGFVKYDPRSDRGTFRKWWVILKCDKEIIKYYQHIFYKLYWKKLQTAIWSSHISLVRGEVPNKRENWNLYNGKEIEFFYEYDEMFQTNSNDGGKHFWLKAWSSDFKIIRESLGLNPEPKIMYHISIGSLNT